MRTYRWARAAVLTAVAYGLASLMASPALAHEGTRSSAKHVLIDVILWAAAAGAVLFGILVLFWGLRAVGRRLERR